MICKCIATINGTNIFEHDGSCRGKEKVNSIASYGMVFMLYNWLVNNGEEETIEGVFANTSGLRDGNALDIHDEYRFDLSGENEDLYINYVYTVNGTVWAVLYDKANGVYYGDFELPNP